MQVDNEIGSPCRNICRLHENVCVGCLRTLQEIERWQSMTRNEKIAVFTRIEQSLVKK